MHVAVPMLLPLHMQLCELKQSEKTSGKCGIKLFHLSCSAPAYRTLAMAGSNITCADFCNPFRQYQLGLEKQTNKMVLSPKIVSVLAYCRSPAW